MCINFNYANAKLCSLKHVVKALDIPEILNKFNYCPFEH